MVELKNSRWEQFAQLRADGATNSAAYAEAYSKPEDHSTDSNGQRLAQREPVAERITDLENPAGEDGSAVKQEFVIEGLLQNLKQALTPVAVLDRSGKPSGVFRTNASAANKALELLGRTAGLFQERTSRKSWESAEPDWPDFDSMNAEKVFSYFRTQMQDLNPCWVLFDRNAATLTGGGNRDELVQHFRAQLHLLDPSIVVFDPASGETPPASAEEDSAGQVQH